MMDAYRREADLAAVLASARRYGVRRSVTNLEYARDCACGGPTQPPRAAPWAGVLGGTRLAGGAPAWSPRHAEVNELKLGRPAAARDDRCARSSVARFVRSRGRLAEKRRPARTARGKLAPAPQGGFEEQRAGFEIATGAKRIEGCCRGPPRRGVRLEDGRTAPPSSRRLNTRLFYTAMGARGGGPRPPCGWPSRIAGRAIAFTHDARRSGSAYQLKGGYDRVRSAVDGHAFDREMLAGRSPRGWDIRIPRRRRALSSSRLGPGRPATPSQCKASLARRGARGLAAYGLRDARSQSDARELMRR